MTTNIKDYSTTQASNTSLNGIDVDEGMLPSNLNNAIRALMKNTRDFANDSQWFEFGVGSGAYTSAWVSTTQFTIASSVDISAIYHVGRRLKILKADASLVYGSITATSNNGTLQTITATFDSGNLGASTNALRIYIGALSKTNSSIPTEIIGTSNIANNAITTAKILDNNVTVAKMADNSVDSDQYIDGSIDTIHIANSQITNAKLGADSVNGSKIADNSIDSEHYVDGSIDTAHLGNAQVSTVKIADNNITTAKILNSNVTADKLATDSVVEAKIQNNAVTTNKINNDAVTIDKIADAVIVTNSEHSGHTPNDNTFFTTLAANNRFLNKDTSELISSGQSWTSNDNFIATTAAIDTRVIDLVDDVGGFVPIANQTSFPNTNPDVNNGVGTIVSIQALSQTLTANSSGVVSISNGTVGGSTVTLNNCGANASLPSGFGILVESTTTQHTYNFHRLVPKATEVTAVAAKSTEIGRLGTADAVSDMNTLGTTQIVSNMNTLAGISGLNALASNSSNVTSVANNLSSVNNFAEVYRIASSAPSSSLNSGDLYFNTNTNVLNVYGASGWQNAGSSVNGTSARFKFTVSGTPTSLSGNDDNGNSLSYDANFIDCYLNGIKMVNGTDVTVTSGSAIVFASALTNGDIVEAVAFGTFAVANLNASSLTSGTIPNARYGTPTFSGANLTNLDASDLASGTVPTARLSGAYTGITSLGTITTFRSTGIDDNSSATAITIDSADEVKIGTTTDSWSGANGLVIKEASGDGGMTIVSASTSNNGNIGFADTQSGGFSDMRGLISYLHNGDSFRFMTANAERMRLNSTGLGIGTASPSTKLHVVGDYGSTLLSGTSPKITVQHSGGTNQFVEIQQSGGASFIGTQNGSNDGELYIIGRHTGNNQAKFSPPNVQLYTGNTERMRIHSNGVISSVNGIALGVGTANTASNVLDDYEEGTFTPSLSISSSAAAGFYTKIGNIVHAYFKITTNATGNNITMNGLPFATKGSNPDVIGGARETNTTGRFYQIAASQSNTSAYIFRYDNSNSISSGMVFQGSLIYQTN